MELLKAVVLGIVEGVTEWLPISSTGHLILLNNFLTLDVSEEFWEMFEVVIQLGAILAAVILFWNKLWPFGKRKTQLEKKNTWLLWSKIIVAVLPSAVIGFLLDDWFNDNFYNYLTVAVTLIVYGAAFIFIERGGKDKALRTDDVFEITYREALFIGMFQVLSIIPGTSRSGSTILGAMLLGLGRSAAAEFSFFLAIPTMAGASLLKAGKFVLSGTPVESFELLLLAVASLSAFAVSLWAIRFLVSFVKKHTFSSFGVYRIALGLIVLGWHFFA